MRMFVYHGDSVGSKLTNGEKYRITESPYQATDMVTVENIETREVVTLTQEVISEYREQHLISAI